MIDFERLFEDHGPRLVELAASILGARADAEDAVQEAFVKAYRARDRFRGDASPGSWLWRIVFNEALEQRRRKRLRGGRTEAGGAAVAVREEPPASGPGPDATASALERAEAVRRAIDALPEDQRTVVLLRELEGWTYREISERLELPLGTVESRVIRARERLRLVLQRQLVDPAERREETRRP